MKHVSELMKKPDVVIDHSQSVSALLGKLSADSQPSAVITRDGAYAGMLDVFGLLKSRMDIATTKLSGLIESAPTLSANDTVVRAGQLFSQSPLRTLAIVDDGSVQGVVTQEAVQEILGVRDADISISVDSEATLGTLINVLRENKAYAAAVVEEETIIGAVTLAQLLNRYYAHHQTRDEGMRPSQKTKGFTAEKSSVLNLPVDSLIQDMTADIEQLLVPNSLLKSVVSETPNREISFVGLDTLPDVEKVSVKDLFTELYDKLLVHEHYQLKVHVKTYHDDGNQQKVSVHLHGQTVHGDKLEATADEWGLEKAARSAMDKLEWQIRKLSDGAK